MERVEHDALSIGESIGFDDVHAPAGKRSGDGGEERRPIGSKQCQRKCVAAFQQFCLDRLASELLIKSEMRGNFSRRMDRKIPSRESFQAAVDVRAAWSRTCPDGARSGNAPPTFPRWIVPGARPRCPAPPDSR